MHILTPALILEELSRENFSSHFDAVVLFVDTSGFTRLTARLADHGREGAEVLANILQAVFEPLVEAVYTHGGFIAGFAGDAFKAVFPGLTSDSYLHALATAEQIRSHMAAHPNHETKYGIFDFLVRLSIGDGSVTWFIWDSHLVDVAQSSGFTFSGPAMDAAILGEDFADGGELVVTRSVYATLRTLLANAISGVELSDDAANYIRIDQMTEQLPASASITNTKITNANTETRSPETKEELDTATLGNASRFYSVTLLESPFRGEFRTVYSLFVNVQSLPDPGTNEDFLPTFFQLLHQYGGYLCRIGRIGASDTGGGTFLLFWGAPISYENDLNRALSFLIELQTQIGVVLRAGVTHAVVYAGFVGSALREEYTCHGSSVNQAARQMGAAEWGQILLDEETAQRGQDEFEVVLAGEYEFKGLVGTQPIFALVGQRSHITGNIYLADFVGREGELTQLQAAIQPIIREGSAGQSADRFAGITLIRGEAGIGKSRLVHEFLKRLDGQEKVQFLIAQTDEILRESLNPFRYILHHYFEQSPNVDEETNRSRFATTLQSLISSTDDDELQTELTRALSFLGALVNLRWPDSLYEQLDPKFRYENTVVAIKTLIKAESLRRPLLLLLEDVQWIDEDSRSILQDLTHNVNAFPFAILITARPPDSDGRQIVAPELIRHEIQLAALTKMDVADMVRDHLTTAASTELIDLLMTRAEGNPFFAEQMLLYLQERGLLVDGKAGWQLKEDTDGESALPEDVQAVLVARLDRLSQAVKQVVQTAAVLGREFNVQILSMMLRNDARLDDKVQSAQDAAVWNSLTELRYLFRHALLHDAAYEMQLRAQLRSLHESAARAIEHLYAENPAPYYPDLVYHYHHAGSEEKERTYVELAGREALDQFANHDAATFLARALELTSEDALEERYTLHVLRERVFKLQGNRPVQQQNLDVMAALAEALENPTYQAQASLLYAEFHAETSNFPAATEAAQRAIELAEQADNTQLQAQGYDQWGRTLWPQAKYREAEAMALKALALAREAGLRKQEADALVVQGIALWYLGDYEVAQRVLEASIPIYGELNLRFAQYAPLLNLALLAQNLGDHLRALNYLQQSLALEQERGSRKGQAIAATNMGLSYQNLGDYIRAEKIQQKALTDFREINDRFGQIVSSGNLASIAMEFGNYADARARLSNALEICRAIGSQGQEAGLLAKLSEVDVAEDLLIQGHAKAQEAVEIAAEVGHRDTEAKALIALGNVLLAQHKPGEATRAFDSALTIRRELNESKRSMEAYAGLARCALHQDDLPTAVTHITEILNFIETDTLDGAISPFAIYLTCYQVLERSEPENAQRAWGLLTTAYDLLQERIAHVNDEKMRHSFLNDVVVNREIVRAYEEGN